ncbi:uncharacterized protein LOC121777066 [Salvia splendens]|uniref:uncharacterized protein LOC121777066 n=1 Tax=Salvia splendens TaxID=180675 RepID=UPI001C2734CF|nr:uncharacterized protein LOC121777066 [Salvia splendens]XP_042030133.1 uncharacterized protein LOC121777066 [Salvia splendens]
MSICFDVGRFLKVTWELVTDERVDTFKFADDMSKAYLLSLCDDSNNKQWLDGSCKECPVTVSKVEDVVVVAATVVEGKEIVVMVVVRVGIARVVKETRIVIIAVADEKTARNGTIHWLYYVPIPTIRMKLLQIIANRVFDGGGMDGPFICVIYMGIFCYMLLHTPNVACISSQSCNDATWHRLVLRRNSQTRSALDVHCSLRTRNFMGGVLVATNWKMHWESYGESMAVEGEPIMPVKDALVIYEKEFGNSRNFLLQFGVDARAGERLYHGKVNGIEYVQYIVAFSYYITCSQAKELTAILSVIRNLNRFSVRFPKPMVKMKL